MDRRKFSFFESYYTSFEKLPPKVVGEVVQAMGSYFFKGEEKELHGMAESVFALIKPILDSSKIKAENGKKGGAPKGNDNASKQANDNQKTTKKQANDNQTTSDIGIGIRNKDIKDKDILEKENNKRKRKPTVAESRIGKEPFGDEVYMTRDEYLKLVDLHGQEGADRIIEILDNYKVSSGHTYIDDYRAAIGWPTKEYKKEKAAEERINKQRTGQNLADKWGL